MKKLVLSVVLACSCASGAYCMGSFSAPRTQEEEWVQSEVQNNKIIQNWVKLEKKEIKKRINTDRFEIYNCINHLKRCCLTNVQKLAMDSQSAFGAPKYSPSTGLLFSSQEIAASSPQLTAASVLNYELTSILLPFPPLFSIQEEVLEQKQEEVLEQKQEEALEQKQEEA
ncbi:MAG: hypothetical protein LBG13_01605, partial [Holosporales bacterium]|nr:hypothetical protein [Holosporales bacterium]